jgi:DNA-binding NarL/FixJ family response regulator
MGTTAHETQLSENIKVLVVAENRLLREALARVLRKDSGIRVLSAVDFASGTVNQIAAAKPHVLILDSTGLESSILMVAVQALREVPGLKVILIGMEADHVAFLRSVRAGIAGYLLKDASGNEVVAAVNSTARGKAVCPPELCLALFNWVARQEVPISNLNGKLQLGLTGRELQILQIINCGLRNKEIAMQLNLSEQTVKNHVHRLLHKLGAANRQAALELFHLQGLTPVTASLPEHVKAEADNPTGQARVNGPQ